MLRFYYNIFITVRRLEVIKPRGKGGLTHLWSACMLKGGDIGAGLEDINPLGQEGVNPLWSAWMLKGGDIRARLEVINTHCQGGLKGIIL